MSLISDLFCNEAFEKNRLELISALSYEDQIFKTNFFKELLLKNKENMLELCNEYYHTDSSIMMRDFLENNYLIVGKAYLRIIQDLIRILLSYQNHIDKQILLKTKDWILENLLTFCQSLTERWDLWYISKDRVQAKKHSEYKKLKKFTISYYEDTFRILTEAFHSQINHNEENPVFFDKLFKLRLSIVNLFENFGWSQTISSSTYYELAEKLPILSDFLKSQTPSSIRFFVLPQKRKLDDKMDTNTYSKLIKSFVHIASCLLKEKQESFLETLPTNSYFIRLIKRVFNDEAAAYLEKDFRDSLKSVLKHTYPHVNLEFISDYFTKNIDEVTNLIDKYSFYSYGDSIFSEVLFIFTDKKFPETVQRPLWTAMSIYARSFNEALANPSIHNIVPEEHVPTFNIKYDLRDFLETIASQVSDENDSEKRSVLKNVLDLILKV